jgi:hypothetical protein
MDGGPRFEPVSVIGDVGQHILGGRSNYTITWNVFDDLEEVGDVEFFIKVSLADELSESDETEDDSQSGPFKKSTSQGMDIQHSAFIGFNGSTYSPFGISGGSLNKYGFFGSARAGTNNDEFQNDIWVTIVAGFTIHGFSRGIYRLHGYAGVGTSVEYYEELETSISSTDPMFVAEGGLMHVVGRINLTTGLVFVTGYGLHFVYGVGFMF